MLGTNMLANLLVPGAVHAPRLAKALHELGVLNQFVYSYARSMTPKSIGLPDERAINLWPKEYLTRGHLRFIGWHFTDVMFPMYNRLWEQGVLSHWQPAPVVHTWLWGAARRVLERARKERSTTLGMVVNSHPAEFVQLLAEEGDRLGVRQRTSLSRLNRAVLDEVSSCDHLHAESEFTRKSFIARGFPAERIHVVHPGQDLSRFYPLTEQESPNDDHRFRVISVGHIGVRKGQIHLLKAWQNLGLQNAELLLIGAMHSETEHLFRPFAHQFTHIPRVPNEDLRRYLVQSSVMVTPSIEDGYALVVGEALTCGIPVIVTVNTGAADLIRNGVNGYVIPIASPEAIAEKLLALYRDRNLLQSLQEGARATIPIIDSWKGKANEFAELYRRILPSEFNPNA